MKLLVEARGLSLVRQKTKILSGIDFILAPDEHVAIIGPNGAGKSFLLRVLSADLIPSDGEVKLFGKQFGKVSLWELRRRVGYVSSRMVFRYEGQTKVHDIVCSGFHGTYGLGERVTAAEEMVANQQLSFFGLHGFEERVFETLSDGERRKVLLARAMVNRPELLIFDEPCIGLDIRTRDRFLEDIDKLAKTIPSIYVTHYLEELPSCITKVHYLKNGKTFGEGSPSEMLTGDWLSRLFDCPLEVVQRGSRYLCSAR